MHPLNEGSLFLKMGPEEGYAAPLMKGMVSAARRKRVPAGVAIHHVYMENGEHSYADVMGTDRFAAIKGPLISSIYSVRS